MPHYSGLEGQPRIARTISGRSFDTTGDPVEDFPNAGRPAQKSANSACSHEAAVSRFSGQLNLKWGRVANCRYYEFQTISMEMLVDESSWATRPVTSCPRTTYTLEAYPSGTMIAIRVRAFGSKGAGPWCESINPRVS